MDLNISSTEEAKSLGSQITSKGEEFKAILTKIQNVNSNINSAWQGTDATAYCDELNEQIQQLTQLFEKVIESGNYVSTAAALYEEARNSSTISAN